MSVRVQLAGVSVYHPPDEWSSAAVEDRLRAASPGILIPAGIVEQVTGIRTRRYAAGNVQSSDLAVEAARRVLERTETRPQDLDLLIFASASQDLVEPATANIVQEKIGARCPVFDIKNACNSFLNAVQVGESLIQNGTCQTVLIATGEKPSVGINWSVQGYRDLKRSFIGYTFGDAGAAAVLRRSTGDSGIFYRSFRSLGRHWPLATVPGGGTMHPRGDEYTTFRGDGDRLKKAFLDEGADILTDALRATEVSAADFARVIVHQVSLPAYERFISAAGVPADQVELTVRDRGNMAAASMPVAFAQAEERGAIRPGNLVMWIGLAAGISLGIMLMRS